MERIGFASMLDYMKVDENGGPHIDLSRLTLEKNAAIQQVTVYEYTKGHGKNARVVKRTTLKLMDKIRALELLGKHLKLFTDKVEVTGLGGLTEKIGPRVSG